MRPEFSMKKIVNYFFNGLLLVLPLAATFLILAWVIVFVDTLVPLPIPGMGVIIVLVVVTLVGYLGRNVVAQPALKFVTEIIEKMPGINIIYRSTREFAEAFLGEERKFEKPVLYDALGNGTFRIGFLTQESLTNLGLENHVGVYVPHSYNFSGNFYMVERSRIRPLELSSAAAMRFAVTGGAVNLGPQVQEAMTPKR